MELMLDAIYSLRRSTKSTVGLAAGAAGAAVSGAAGGCGAGGGGGRLAVADARLDDTDSD